VDGGIALDPKTPRNGIQRIEIKGNKVLVNGAQVPETVLGSWLQQDAEPILELLTLPSAERREFFDLPPDPTAEILEAPVETEITASETDPIEEDLEVAAAASAVDAFEAAPAATTEAPEAPLSRPASTAPELERATVPVHSDGRVVVGRSLTVRSDEIAEDVVVIGNNLRIEGEVLGDALAVGGRVWVDGRVSGDVAAIGGGVELKEGARIHGDVVSVGGGIEREAGAQVFGEITEVAVGAQILDFSRWGDWDWGFEPPRIQTHSPFRGFWRTAGGLAKIFWLIFIASLVFLILQPQVRRAERIAAAEPWKAGLVGLAAMIGFFAFFLPLLVIVCIVLTVTIVGIPLVLLLIFGVVVAAIALPLMGYAASALRVGGILQNRFPGRLGQGVILVVVGVVAIEVWSFLAHILSGAGWILALPVFLFAFFGWLVRFSAWTVGLGAVLLSFQTRNDAALGTSAALPPLPPLPGADDPVAPVAEDLEALHQDLDDLQDELEAELRKDSDLLPSQEQAESYDEQAVEEEAEEESEKKDDDVPPSPS